MLYSLHSKSANKANTFKHEWMNKRTSGLVCHTIKGLLLNAQLFWKCLKWLARSQGAALANPPGEEGYYIIGPVLMCTIHVPGKHIRSQSNTSWRCVWTSANGDAPQQVWVQTHCAVNPGESGEPTLCNDERWFSEARLWTETQTAAAAA